MKQTADNKQVPSRCYYYLLDFNERDKRFMIGCLFGVKQLNLLTYSQFWELFQYATKLDLKRK